MRKILAIILILSALSLLLGCTPNKEETKPTVTPPDITEPNRTEPAEQTGTVPGVPTSEASGLPAGTEELPATESPAEEEDTDVQDTYTIIVDPGIGVGGN